MPFTQQCEAANSKTSRVLAELEAMKEIELPSTFEAAEAAFEKYRAEFARILK